MKEAVNATLIFVAVLAGLSSVPSGKAVAKVETAEQSAVEPSGAETIPDLPDFPPATSPPAPQEPPSPCVSINGEDHDVDAFIAQHYKRPWTFPGTIDGHLVEHGVAVADLASLTHGQKLKLHSAIHEKELAERPVAKAQALAPRIVQNCPGGTCPAPQYQAPRRGLFGRRR